MDVFGMNMVWFQLNLINKITALRWKTERLQRAIDREQIPGLVAKREMERLDGEFEQLTSINNAIAELYMQQLEQP